MGYNVSRIETGGECEYAYLRFLSGQRISNSRVGEIFVETMVEGVASVCQVCRCFQDDGRSILFRVWICCDVEIEKFYTFVRYILIRLILCPSR